MDPLSVAKEDIATEDVRALLLRHHALMSSQSPAESCHVMDPQTLLGVGAHLLGVRRGDVLLGVGALVEIAPFEGEIKSMHTAQEARGQGVGHRLVAALLDLARANGMQRVNLETGSEDPMIAARQLYRSAGFVECPPFGSYRFDPLSVFMTRTI